MSVEERFGHFFKPEVRSAGTEMFEDGLAVVNVASDTGIQGYVKGAASSKVTLKSASIESPVFSADCSCPASAKGAFCKHIWAVMLQTEKKSPDFLEAKTDIEKSEAAPKTESPYKAKQAEYRKEQYQKQKARARERAGKPAKPSKFAPPPPSYPEDVAEALEYFNQNGFPLEEPFDPDLLKDAKRKLARLFHPDRGGTHDEAVTLNHHSEVLLEFFETL